jgi:hypothetical protein
MRILHWMGSNRLPWGGRDKQCFVLQWETVDQDVEYCSQWTNSSFGTVALNLLRPSEKKGYCLFEVTLTPPPGEVG